MLVMTMEERIKAAIRDIKDFPKEGVVFKDLAPVFGDAELLRGAVDLLAEHRKNLDVSLVAAVDARGFVLAGALAVKLGAGLVPIRKQGKLPYRTVKAEYELEYGSAVLEMHVDACAPGEPVLLVDDLLATGGTAAAAINLIERVGGRVVGVDFLVELAFLGGRRRLAGHDVFSPIVYGAAG